MRADLQEQINTKISEVRIALAKVGNRVPFGHAFIWGNVPVKLKNGNTKYYRTCITSVCSDDLDGCLRVAESMGIQGAFYNLD